MEDCYITERGDQAFHCQKYRHSLRNSRSKKKKKTKKKPQSNQVSRSHYWCMEIQGTEKHSISLWKHN